MSSHDHHSQRLTEATGLESLGSEPPLVLVICCCSDQSRVRLLVTPEDCSLPGFPVLHYLMEFAQTHVHLVGDAIQPFHPLSS